MSNVDDRSKQAAEIRRLAEGKLRVEGALVPENVTSLSPEEMARTVHELRVHQIELEMQNEELRRVQDDLISSRARYFDLYDFAPVGYCTLSDQGIIREANLVAAKLLGLTRKQLLNRPLSQFIYPEDQDIYYKHRTQLFKTGEPQVCELRMVAQGEPFWVRLEAVAAQDADGSVVCRVIMIDITKHQQEELALRDALAEAQLFRDALDHDATYIYIKDTHGRYLYANKQSLELFHCSAEELIGSDDSRFFPPATVNRIKELDARVFAGDQSSAEVDVADTGSGRHVYWEVKTPIYSDAQHTSISGLLGITTDITERKQFEEVQTFLAQTSSGTLDEPFFYALARYLAETLGMDFVCVDRLEGDGLNARTVAVWCDGQFEDNVTYALKDTPCGDVVGKTVCCFPASVCAFFPRDQVLEDLKAESYVGVTLWSHSGEPIGLIAVIGRRPLGNRKLAEDVLRLVGVRAAGELERLEAESILQQSEERFRSLFEAAPLGYQSLNEEGYFVEVNQAWLDTLGYHRDEVMGKWFGDFLAPEYADAFRKRFPLFKAAGKIHSEFQMLHKDGSRRFISFEGRIGYHLDGVTFKQTHCILADITEHKQAELYREMSIDILQMLNEPASQSEIIQHVLNSVKSRTGFDAVGIRLQDGDDYPYYVQDGFTSEFLSTENSLMERDADGGLCRDSDGNIRLECTCGLVISGKTDSADSLMTRGGSVWINDSLPLLEMDPDEDPRYHPRNTCVHQGYSSVALIPIKYKEKIVGLIQLNDKRKGRFNLEMVEMLEGIATHIGSTLMRKRVEDELQESQHRYQTLFDGANDGIFLLSADCKLISINESFARMHGYRIDEMLNMSLSDLDTPESSQLAPERIRRMLDGEAMIFDVEHFHKDGHIIPLEVSGSLVTCGDQRLVQCYHRDITERKKAEEEKAVLESQLRQAQKMESIGRLAGGVAHDFNNMLGVIIGNTQMAMEELEPRSPIYEELTEVSKAAERSAELTRNLLAFARKQTVAPRVIDLNSTVKNMLKTLQRLIGESIALQWQPMAGLWPIKMDPSQIDQMLVNLCVNARDAINGVGTITILTDNTCFDEEYCAVHVDCMPGAFVRLTLSDSGCGMDSELLSHIFEPFFTTKGVGEGTGLGLSSVYGAIKQNNGFITAYSELGQGTTFSIYIPRYVNIAGEVPLEHVTVPAIRGHETILLVEDEPAILRMTRVMLERLGYTVITATTPGEATKLAEQHHGDISLLFSDVMMPEMNGRELAKNLLSLYPHMSRLFMSGYTSDVIAEQGKLDDGVYFIQKPFSMGELSTVVRRALDGKQ